MNEKRIFNKLVRDKIPEIIENNGDIPEIEILDDSTYSKMLDEKLLEECNEILSASNNKEKTEEIADALEVLYAMAEVIGVTMSDIETIRLDKQEKRGAFKKKILLKSTTPKN